MSILATGCYLEIAVWIVFQLDCKIHVENGGFDALGRFAFSRPLFNSGQLFQTSDKLFRVLKLSQRIDSEDFQGFSTIVARWPIRYVG